MTSSLTIRKARREDLDTIQSLLKLSNLPVDGVAEHIENFLLAESNGNIAGTIGLEIYPPVALLRSTAVLHDYRNLGIGTMLFNMLLRVAVENNLTELYLFTNTAEVYFKRKGFAPITRNSVQGKITSSEEFRIHTCNSAVLMKRDVETLFFL